MTIPPSAFPLPHSRDRIRGVLLGLALGDALGMPVDRLSHVNVRTYYKGIKELVADEKRGDLGAGQWTVHTQRASALARTLTRLRPAADHAWSEALVEGLDRELEGVALRRAQEGWWGAGAAAPACAAPFGVWAHATGADDEQLAAVVHAALWKHAVDLTAIAAATGMARAVALALEADPAAVDGPAFFAGVSATTAWVEEDSGMEDRLTDRMAGLARHLDDFPLDLQDRCGGTDDAAAVVFPFSVAMAARGPALAEATLLSAVNVGGAASAVGAMTGALLGAFNGWSAFPAEWRGGGEDADRLLAEADALAEALGL